MTEKKAIHIIQDDLLQLKADGVHDIDIDKLIEYVKNLELHDEDHGKYSEHLHQNNLAEFESNIQRSIEMFRSVIEAGKDALRAAMIINGGAVLALLTLLGNIGLDNLKTFGADINKAIAIFSIGVLLTAISYGSRYCSQFSFANYWMKTGYIFNILSISLALGSYVTFSSGVHITYLTFSTIK